MKHINPPKNFTPVSKEDKRVIFEQLGCNVKDHYQGILVNDYFVVSLRTNKWRTLDHKEWYRHKHDIKHFVDNYVVKSRINKATLTKAIYKMFGWVKLEPLHYIKDGVSIKKAVNGEGWLLFYYTEMEGETKRLDTVQDLMDVYLHKTGKELTMPDLKYFRGYINPTPSN